MRKEIRELARALTQETLHGPVPTETVMRLASAILEDPETLDDDGFCRRVMRRDIYHDGHRVAVARIHDAEKDEPIQFFLPMAMELMGIVDGDEFEITLVKTGKRPHGDRRFVRVGPPRGLNYERPETDDECLERIRAADARSATKNTNFAHPANREPTERA
jgi:hypothetical protein